MQLIKTLIVEDEKHCEDRLLEMLYASHTDKIQILGVARCMEEAEKKINSLQPQLLFLDVHLGSETTLDLLPKIEWKNLQIIFTTSFQSYMMKAFEFSAIHYLLKPLEEELLDEAMRRVYDNTARLESAQVGTLLFNKEGISNEQRRITVANTDGKHLLRLGEIIRCQSDVNYTTFYLTDGKKLTVSKPLKHFDELLSPHNFFRTHQSHLINLNEVKKYLSGKGGIALMSNGDEVEVSTRKKEEFLERIL